MDGLAEKTYATSKHGIEGSSAVTHARAMAEQHAVRIAAISGNIWPNNPNMLEVVARELIDELVKFSIATRRYLELTGVAGERLKGSSGRWMRALEQLSMRMNWGQSSIASSTPES